MGDNATLEAWLHLQEVAEKALGDEEEEADMERINSNIERALASAGVPAYNESETPEWSLYDYFTDLIYRARLAPHRDELQQLFSAWKAGDEHQAAVIIRVEQLIDE